MWKSKVFAMFAAIAMGIAVFSCKAEIETEYIDKTYAEAVTFTAEDAGEAGVKVTMSTATEKAAIYYTTDGTEPTEESERYTEAVTFSKDTVVKAIAVKAGIENSPVSVANVSIKTKTVEVEKIYAETVTFTAEDAGDAGVKVAMSTATEEAAIYYTTDGTEPTENSERYTEAVTFSKDTMVKAIAVKAGIENSPVSVANVSIKTKTVEVGKIYAEAVTFTAEDAGEEGVKVAMYTATEEAAIYYTTDGTEPTENSERYTEAVTFSKDTVVKAIAVKQGIENSPISVANVSIKTKTVEVEKTVEIEKVYAKAVTFTAEDAGEAGVKVAMSTATEGAAIYYTTDGTEPTENSERYTEAVTFSKDTVVKAIAVKQGIENSPVSVANVSIKTKTVEVEKTVEIEKVYAEAVTFTAEDAGEAGVKVAMSTATEGAAIYYTIDESSESLKYSEPLTFSKDTEIKAFAVKEGIENSPISVAKVSITTKTITEKVYVCAKCQKEYNTAQEAIDCCAETPDTTAPADVTELKATPKDSSVVLTWKDAADDDIFGCLVSWKVESAGRAVFLPLEKDSLIAAKGQQGCVVSGLKNGATYTFTVKTMDTSGNTSGGVEVKAAPKAGETLKISLSVPKEKSNTSVTVTVNIETAAEDVKKVVYKKDGSLIASELLKDSDATEAVKDGSDNKKWTFEIKAADETANGTYAVAALDSDGREETSQIEISNFDFTPPADVEISSGAYSFPLKEIVLKWTNPKDEDFDHVEISYTSTNGTEESEKSKAESVTGTEKTFEGIDGNKESYTYFFVSVDKLGNKSAEKAYKVILAGFVKIPAVSIAGTESWTPGSDVFISGRKLEIASFYMSDHEVTRGEYEAVMGSDPSTATVRGNGHEATADDVKNSPVNNIRWYDAIVYCNTRSIKEGLIPCYKIDGKTEPSEWGEVPKNQYNTWDSSVTCDFTANGYRLPTEAEWEWAARGGKSYTYAGDDDIGNVAWYKDLGVSGTIVVKARKPNGYGLYDMSGNVREWCWDWMADSIGGELDSISVDTPSTGAAAPGSYTKQRVIRGGSWNKEDKYASVNHRESDEPFRRYKDSGFRVVLSAN